MNEFLPKHEFIPYDIAVKLNSIGYSEVWRYNYWLVHPSISRPTQTQLDFEDDYGTGENENTHTTIYKLGKKFIRVKFHYSDYMYSEKYTYEFVKPVKKKIVVYEYSCL